MTKTRRPSSFRIGRSLTVRVVRGPHKDDPNRWYWRADQSTPDGRQCVWSGWGTAAEVEQRLAGRVHEGSLDDPTHRERDGIRTVKDLMEVWVGHQQERASAGRIAAETERVYELTGRRICQEPIAKCSLTELKPGRLERYVNHRLAAGAAPASIRLELTLIKAAWDWGRQLEIVPQRLLRKPDMKVPKKERFTPTREEWNRVLEHLGGWARDLLATQGLLGCRIGALVKLRHQDVDLARGTVTLRNKGKVRTIPLPPEAKVILSRLSRADAAPESRVFNGAMASTMRATVGKVHLAPACNAAGVPYFTPHGLRRMVERELALAGVPIQTFAAILGHSPQVALSAYSAVREEDMSAAFNRAGIGESTESEE